MAIKATKDPCKGDVVNPASGLNIEFADSGRWSELAARFSDYNYRQMHGYAVKAAERVGATSENVVVWRGSELLGLVNVRVKHVPMSSMALAYVNGGPLVRFQGTDDEDEVLLRLKAVLQALKEEYVVRRNALLRVAGTVGRQDMLATCTRAFQESRYRASVIGKKYRTIILDISQSPVAIREQLAPKWRSDLKKAENEGLTIVRGTDDEFFVQFQALFEQLLAKKRFSVNQDVSFFRNTQKLLTGGERFVVHLALSQGEPVAGHLGSYLGDTAIYLLGASNESGLRQKASYLLQWSVIAYAQSLGCRWYDLGGIDPVSNPGVYRFKQRMGGSDVTVPGPYEASGFVVGHVVTAAETIYRKLVGIRNERVAMT